MALVSVRVPPMDLFDHSCASCHGEYGSMYDRDSVVEHADIIREKVRDMVKTRAFGRDRIELADPDLDALTAYTRSAALGGVFVCVSKTSATEIVGEATPDAEIRVIVNGESLRASREQHTWRVSLPRTTPITSIRIVATLNGLSAEIVPGPAASAWAVALPTKP